MGFEPMTSCLLDRRSNQLSYGALRVEKVCIVFVVLKKNCNNEKMIIIENIVSSSRLSLTGRCKTTMNTAPSLLYYSSYEFFLLNKEKKTTRLMSFFCGTKLYLG